MILLLLFILVATNDNGSLERGVFFHEETKILGRKICKRPILSPYQKFDIQLTESLDKVAKELQNMWQMTTYRCLLISQTQAKTNSK